MELIDVASRSLRGSLTVLSGTTVALVINSVGAIIIARILQPAEYGLYAISLVLPGFFLLFSDWGINSALVRYISRYSAQETSHMVPYLEWVGQLFKLALGYVLSLALYLSSDTLSTYLLRRPEASGYVRVASFLVLAQSLYQVSAARFQGHHRMDLLAGLGVAQAVVKSGLSILLIYRGMGVMGPVVGYVASYLVTGFAGCILTLFSASRRGSVEGAVYSGGLGEMLGYGFPLFLGGVVAGFSVQFQGLLLSWFVSNAAYGNYQIANQFTRLAFLLTGAVGTVLFPAFSRLDYRREPGKAAEAFRSSVRYSALVLVPLTVLMAVFSRPAVHTIYTDRYPEAPLYFSLLVAPMVLVGTGSLSINSFMNSQGDTRTTMKLVLAGAAMSVALAVPMTWKWGVTGLLVGNIIASTLTNLLSLKALDRNYSIYPELGFFTRTLACSALTGAASYKAVSLVSTGVDLLDLALGAATYFALYMILAPVTGAIQHRDLRVLNRVFKKMGTLHRPVHALLRAETIILNYLKQLKGKTEKPPKEKRLQ